MRENDGGMNLSNIQSSIYGTMTIKTP
jgi:hypothetical protein